MSGFLVTRHPDTPRSPLAEKQTLPGISISAHDDVAHVVTERGHTVLIDGYAFGMAPQELADALDRCDDAILSRVDGQYSALVIAADGSFRGHGDRAGGRTLCWSNDPAGGLTISSRWDLIPKPQRQWDPTGLAEILRYRYTTGRPTLLRGVSQLPRRHRVCFSPDGTFALRPLAPLLAHPKPGAEVPFRRKLDETRGALLAALEKAAEASANAAVFLSGGVDSSLLAALARQCFSRSILVTPVFREDANPELAAAKAFAGTLELEHLLVPVDERRLEEDLRTLVRLTGLQVNFHMLAMHQLYRAVPEEYPLVLLGDAADTLFGTTSYRRVGRRLSLKRRADLVPAAALRALAKLPSQRLRMLVELRDTPAVEVAMSAFSIPYDRPSRRIVRSLAPGELDDIYPHRRLRQYLDGKAHPQALRYLLQDISLQGRGAQHFVEEGLSADCFGKQNFLPFLASGVLEAAGTLSAAQYFGKQHAKPVLRELACEHYDRRLIYRRKHGFEVPYVAWLEGPLAHLVAGVRRERSLFDGRLLADLDVRRHYSLFWSLINWQLAAEEIGRESDAAFAAAGPPEAERAPRRPPSTGAPAPSRLH